MIKKRDAAKSVSKLVAPKEAQKEARRLAEKTELEPEHVGVRIREFRIDKGLSQGEVATDTGLSQSYISRIEKCDAMPSRDVLDRISNVLKTSLATLVDGTTSESALEELAFTQSHSYCPNVDCPRTVYRSGPTWAKPVAELRADYYWAIKEEYPPDRPVVLAIERKRMGLDITVKEVLIEWRNMSWHGEPCEIEYRWVPTDENTVFCEECGTKLRNTCPSCEALLKVRNQKFCQKCGRQLNKPPEQEKGGEA